MASNFVRNNPSITAALEKNIMEHISLMAQEQVMLEFPQEMAMLPQMQQAAVMNPQVQQQMQQITQKLEARKAILIADMTEEFMKEEKQITSQFDHDPLLKLKQREVDLKAMEAERKMKEDEARINLDKAKMVQAKDLTEQKLEQNEDLAKLRADTSIEKSLMSMGSKLASDAAKTKDVEILKGPKR
jgi:glucan-binding YG repeat protein